jgi:hypothetical protein
MLSPQKISGKPIDLGNVAGDIIQVTGKIWQSMRWSPKTGQVVKIEFCS